MSQSHTTWHWADNLAVDEALWKNKSNKHVRWYSSVCNATYHKLMA